MNKIITGIIIGCTTTFVVKAVYEYGRYSVIREIYDRGWTVATDEPTEEENDDDTKSKEES